MGYLNCKKCNRYYELQEGESPKDFDKCQCGGDLKYVKNVDVNSNLSSQNIVRISGILFGASIMLIPYYLYSPSPTSPSFVLINVDSFIIWGGGGLTAAFIASGKIINGASNGLYSAIISGLIIIIIFYLILNNNFNNPSPIDNIAFFAVLSLVYMLIPGIFSIIGGLIGITIRKVLNKLI
jgi:hypothetical protein